MNILITGGAGFIGSHLVDLHLGRNDQVFVVDNLSTGSKKNIEVALNHPNFHFEHADLLKSKHLSDFIRKADRIYHLAAMVGMYHLLAHPVETMKTNIDGCERILEVISKVNPSARLLVASSSEIYGPSQHEYLNEDDLLPFRSAAHSKWVYATSKFTDEIFSLAYAKAKQIKVTPLRLFNTIGPRQNGIYGMVVPRFIAQAVKNEPVTVYGNGEQTRSFCDVRDTIAALDLIAKNEETIGQVLNVGQDQCVSMNQLADMIIGLAQSKSIKKLIPYKEAYGQEYEDIMHRRPDLNKFYKYTSYKFQWNLEHTLLELIRIKREEMQAREKIE